MSAAQFSKLVGQLLLVGSSSAYVGVEFGFNAMCAALFIWGAFIVWANT